MRGWPELMGTEEKPPPWVSGSQRSWSRLVEGRRGHCLEKATCGPLPISQESRGHGASPHTRPEPHAPAVSGRGAQILPRPTRAPRTPSLHKWASQPAPTSRPLWGGACSTGCAPQNVKPCSSEGLAAVPSPPSPFAAAWCISRHLRSYIFTSQQLSYSSVDGNNFSRRLL